MIRSDRGDITMIGPDFVLGAELLSIMENTVKIHKKTGVNICTRTVECANELGEQETLVEFAELIKQAIEE